MPLSENDEKVLTEEITSEWFQTFSKNTDQKLDSANFITKLGCQLKTHGFEYAKVQDIGCGQGKLLGIIAESFIENGMKLLYSGIDKDDYFVEKTRAKLARRLNSKDELLTRIIEGDCFAGDIDKLPKEINILLASHVAYYTKNENVLEFVNKCVEQLATNGLAVFIHQKDTSTVDNLRTKFLAPTHTDEKRKTRVIRDSLVKYYEIHSVKPLFIEIDSSSNLIFPSNYKKYIDHIRFHMSEVYNRSILETENYKANGYRTTRYLLEFILQRPLEALTDNMLIDYLDEIEKVIKQNKFVMESTIQIALSKTLTPEFAKTFFEKIVPNLYKAETVNFVELTNILSQQRTEDNYKSLQTFTSNNYYSFFPSEFSSSVDKDHTSICSTVSSESPGSVVNVTDQFLSNRLIP